MANMTDQHQVIRDYIPSLFLTLMVKVSEPPFTSKNRQNSRSKVDTLANTC